MTRSGENIVVSRFNRKLKFLKRKKEKIWFIIQHNVIFLMGFKPGFMSSLCWSRPSKHLYCAHSSSQKTKSWGEKTWCKRRKHCFNPLHNHYTIKHQMRCTWAPQVTEQSTDFKKPLEPSHGQRDSWWNYQSRNVTQVTSELVETLHSFEFLIYQQKHWLVTVAKKT